MQFLQHIELFVGEAGKVGPRLHRNGSSVRAPVLIAEVVFVAQQILGQENARCGVSFGGQAPQKFLRVRIPVAVGSYFGEWRVTWTGGWDAPPVVLPSHGRARRGRFSLAFQRTSLGFSAASSLANAISACNRADQQIRIVAGGADHGRKRVYRTLGDLSSPFFGQSLSLQGGFGPDAGTGTSTYLRKISLQLRLTF